MPPSVCPPKHTSAGPVNSPFGPLSKIWLLTKTAVCPALGVTSNSTFDLGFALAFRRLQCMCSVSKTYRSLTNLPCQPPNTKTCCPVSRVVIVWLHLGRGTLPATSKSSSLCSHAVWFFVGAKADLLLNAVHCSSKETSFFSCPFSIPPYTATRGTAFLPFRI